MKKLLSGLLALALLLSACGNPAAEVTPTPTSEPTPTQTAEPTPTPEPTPVYSGVHTDWSKLEPYEPKTAVYTRRYESFTDTLIPAEDYGPLMAFRGAALTSTDLDFGRFDDYLYGLMTQKGEVVVDPAFFAVLSLAEHDSRFSVSDPLRFDVLLLGKLFFSEEGEPQERYALCAKDGSWCTEFLYQYNWDMETKQHLVLRCGIPLTDEKGNLVFVDQGTGKELRKLDLAGASGYEDFYISELWIDPQTGWTSLQLSCWGEGRHGKNVPLLFDPQGKARPLPPEVRWAYRYGDGLVPAVAEVDEGKTSEYRYGYVDAATGEWAIEPVYDEARPFEDGMALVCDETGIYFINTAGERLTDSYSGNQYAQWPTRHGDYWYVEVNEDRAVLDRELNPVDSPLLETSDWVFRQDGWVCGKNREEWVLVRGAEETYRFPVSLGEFRGLRKDRVLFVEGNGRGLGVVTLTDLEGNVIARWDQYSSAYINYEGSVYAFVYGGDSTSDAYYDLDGNQLPTGGRYGYVQDGYVYINGNDATTVTDLDGNVIFCWPIYSADD